MPGRALYRESLTMLQELGYKLGIAASLESLAGVAAAQGRPEYAARLWAAAETLREAVGSPLPPNKRAAYEEGVAAVRAALGEAAFAEVWEEGRRMALEQAIACALGPDE